MTATEPHIVNRFRFEAHHPYLVSDGRRFCSLRVAAASAIDLGKNATVTGPDGTVYYFHDCLLAAANRPDIITAAHT